MPSSTNYIMGASGSGKTSLLNALSGRVLKTKNSELRGSITVNDCIKVTTEVFSNFGCYVMQDDVLFEYFTVREAIRFAARLKLRGSKKYKEERVESIISELGLESCQDT